MGAIGVYGGVAGAESSIFRSGGDPERRVQWR